MSMLINYKNNDVIQIPLSTEFISILQQALIKNAEKRNSFKSLKIDHLGLGKLIDFDNKLENILDYLLIDDTYRPDKSIVSNKLLESLNPITASKISQQFIEKKIDVDLLQPYCQELINKPTVPVKSNEKY